MRGDVSVGEVLDEPMDPRMELRGFPHSYKYVVNHDHIYRYSVSCEEWVGWDRLELP